MKSLLFDIDSTLLEAPSEANAKSSGVMFKKVFNLDATEDLIDNAGKTEMGIILKVISKFRQTDSLEEETPVTEIPDEAYKVWANAATAELQQHPATTLPGINDLLDVLKNADDMQLGLLTGNSYWRAETKLVSAKIDSYFRSPDEKLYGVFGNMSLTRAGLLDIAKQHLIGPNDTLILIDDSLLGAKMAKGNGISSIMVATGKTSLQDLQKYTPYAFPDFGDQRWKEASQIVGSM